jgi:chromate transporter
MLAVCKMVVRLRGNRYFEGVLLGLRPVVSGLIAAAALMLLTGDNFSDYKSTLIFAAAFFAVWRLKLHPILMLVLAGIAGVILY